MTNPSESCDLCGLPVRLLNHTAVYSSMTLHFCCTGCRQVFAMLMESENCVDPSRFRETDLFVKCREMGIIPKENSDMYESVHDLEVSTVNDPGEMLFLDLKIDNMWCPACAWLIEEVLKKNKGIVKASCTFSLDRAKVDYDPVLISPDKIINLIDSLGYKAEIPENRESNSQRSEFVRLVFSAFLSLNVMMFSLALYSDFFSSLSFESIYNLSWPIFIMSGLVLLYGGRNIFRKAWYGLKSNVPGMELLISIGALSAFVYSVINMFHGSAHLYFDTASMLVTLVLTGKFLEQRAKNKIRDDLENILSLRPSKVRICMDDSRTGRYVGAQYLKKNDIFLVTENEVVAADGTILSGNGFMDESTLTGEPSPLRKKPGEKIRSGSVVLNGEFRVRAEEVGDDSILGQMIAIMEKTLNERSGHEEKTDIILKWFVPFVIILAVLTGFICFLSGVSLELSMMRAITVLVISCPCSLGIAIPLAKVAGVSLAGKNGILVKNFEAFQKTENIDTIVLDKTGTVTNGNWKLLKIDPALPFARDNALCIAASLEKDSDHFIGAAIRKYAFDENIGDISLLNVVHGENGISGMLDQHEAKIGSFHFLEKEFSGYDHIPDDPCLSYVYMSFGGRPFATFAFGDTLKENAFKAVECLKTMGHDLVLISGDGGRTTSAVGQELGIEKAFGNCLPQDKASFIDHIKEKGSTVAMVGDGINDSVALVRADLAIAIPTGNHPGRDAADIILMRGDLMQIVDFFDIAKKVNKKVIQNLGWAFIYNIVSIPLAVSGLLHPLIAVIVMLVSSLSVIGNTVLLTKTKKFEQHLNIKNYVHKNTGMA